MSIAPICDFCGNELMEPGALIFGPPASVVRVSDVAKYHVCVACFVAYILPAVRPEGREEEPS